MTLYLPIISSFAAIVFTIFLIRQIQKAPSGSKKMIAISKYIREGAMTYLKRQYGTIAVVAVFLFFAIGFFLGWQSAFGFLLGAVFSGLAGFVGMKVSTTANEKVAEAAKRGVNPALILAFRGGSVTGLLVIGLGLLSVSGLYLLTRDIQALVALGFGGSLISVFARLGGGIYTKAADIGADLVGKTEEGIPEDDPRNPAVIADNVGDNVGDCAGMAADLFETYVVTLVAAMVLGALVFPQTLQVVFLPLMLAALALLASVLAVFFVSQSAIFSGPEKSKKDKNILEFLYRALLVSGILAALGFFPIIKNLVSEIDISFFKIYLAALTGLVVAGGMFIITEYFTSKKYRPVRSIAQASLAGHATNVIEGLAVGFRSTGLPVILISAGILVSFWLGGVYGLAIAVVSMLSLAGIVVALDAYGPITDNAGGIAKMAELPEKVRRVTDLLDEAGNTTKAVTKSYAIASAGFAALVLFSAYAQEVADLGVKVQFLLGDPKVLAGLFIGGLLPYYFSSLALEAVGKAGSKVVEEVRRQFREIKGLIEGRVAPDHTKCIDIVTRAALKEMILPALVPVTAPILVGFLLGPEALGGLLLGTIITGIFMAISMTSGGAAWDNAKKYIEEGNLGGKGSFAHQAAVTGDVVGDPYKDTAGPAINPMIKVANIVAILIAGFLV
jgi:K(+)-stimulated pyrophosphate-energized sodium pump